MSIIYLRQPLSRSLVQAVAFGGGGRLSSAAAATSTSAANRKLSTLSDSNEFHGKTPSHQRAHQQQHRQGRTYDTCALPRRRRLNDDGWGANQSSRNNDSFSNIVDSTTHSKMESPIILIVGGPASGKTSLCDRLAEDCGVDHICAADLLRDEVAASSPLGVEISNLQQKAEEIPSAIILALIRRRIRTSGDGNGRALLTGFPRNEDDTEAFCQLLGKPELAISLDCDDTLLMERELSRTDTKGSNDVDDALQKLRRFRKEHKATINLLREHHVPCVNLDGAASEEGVWNQLLAIGRLMRGPAAA